MTTRRDMLKSGAGLAAILAAQSAPAIIVRSMVAARNSIGMKAGGEKLPYDAEVEYLESTGTQQIAAQYIDTGVVPTVNSRFIFDAAFTRTDATSSFGSYISSFRVFFAVIPSRQIIQAGAGNLAVDLASADTDRHIFDIDIANRVVMIDSALYSFSGWNPSPDAIPPTLYLFARHTSGSVGYASMRIFGCKIYDSGTLVMDLNPVRAGGVGYLCDRVSGQLLRNAGTGAFVTGPDASAGNGGGYKLICFACAYTRSLRPSAQCWRAAA